MNFRRSTCATVSVFALVSLVHCRRARTADAGAPNATSASMQPPVLDATKLQRCSVVHDCSMNHPGLGNFGSSVRVDLSTGAIARASWNNSAQGSVEPTPTPTPTPTPAPRGRQRRVLLGQHADVDAGAAPTVVDARPTLIAPASLAELRARLGRIRPSDLERETEIPQTDTMSCSLAVSCPDDVSTASLRVQRQERGGPGPVGQSIQYLLSL